MILGCDVHYENSTAIVAGVLFESWSSSEPHKKYISKVAGIADYEPGQFYKREMPCILEMLKEHNLNPDFIIVDGYVFLDGKEQKGLGAHLYDALGGGCNIIGIAKNKFKDFPEEMSVLRGGSSNPLYISSIGCNVNEAMEYVQSMHGKNRIPTLIKLADTLCKKKLTSASSKDLVKLSPFSRCAAKKPPIQPSR